MYILILTGFDNTYVLALFVNLHSPSLLLYFRYHFLYYLIFLFVYACKPSSTRVNPCITATLRVILMNQRMKLIHDLFKFVFNQSKTTIKSLCVE